MGTNTGQIQETIRGMSRTNASTPLFWNSSLPPSVKELKSLLDLSRNMSVYRNLLKNDLIVPPIVSRAKVADRIHPFDLLFLSLDSHVSSVHERFDIHPSGKSNTR